MESGLCVRRCLVACALVLIVRVVGFMFVPMAAKHFFGLADKALGLGDGAAKRGLAGYYFERVAVARLGALMLIGHPSPDRRC